MDDIICQQCGTRNEPGTQFCVECQSYLSWAETRETSLAALQAQAQPVVAEPEPAVPEPQPTPRPPTPDPVPVVVADPAPVPPTTGPPRTTRPQPATRPQQPPTEPVRAVLEPTAVEVVPGGDTETVQVQIYNLSPIVDAYRISAPDAPDWLTVSEQEVRLLPGSNDRTGITLRIPGGRLVPAGVSTVVIRVQSVAHPEITVDQPVELTVPGIEVPLMLRLEPSMVRVRDDQPGQLQAVIDNGLGNQARRVTLSGRDPEGVVRFFFAPEVLEVPAGATAAAAVRIEAPTPDPGQVATRQLTIAAADGEEHVTASATFLQTATQEAPMTMRVEPTLVRVRDTNTGRLDVVVDNRGGLRTRRVFLGGRDPERVVHFAFSPPSLDVLAGEIGTARLKIEAPPPAAGQETSRAFTVLATSPGAPDLETPATFVQATSAAPVDAALIVRTDPSVVRSRDSAVGQFEVLVDNRAGHRPRRVFLSGRDPERVVRFTFFPPSLDVLAGEIGRARVRIEAPPPDFGQEATRQITVVASEGGGRDAPPREVEASGSFVQVTSPKPVEAPVGVRLEPSVIRVRDAPNGQLQVVVDNRRGTRPKRVTLTGTDPEQSIGFSFWPAVLEIGPGQVARSQVRIDAYPPEPGRDATRPFTITASVAGPDGPADQEVEGTFTQATSPPPPDEPMTIRLEPSVLRTRNRRTASATVFADNRGGSRPRRVQFRGYDPERVVRFSFNPPVIDLAPGQSGAVRVDVSAPRPDGGEEVTRPFTIAATDGAKETEATGSFIQESMDWRPVWRVLLTLLGAALMIIGVFVPWSAGPLLTGIDFTATQVDQLSDQFDLIQLPDVLTQPVATAGAAIILAALVAVIGLFGPKGRLTRWAAAIGAVLAAGFVVSAAINTIVVARIDVGSFVVLIGCACAFIGGYLAPKRG
jgi:hypothetical protein